MQNKNRFEETTASHEEVEIIEAVTAGPRKVPYLEVQPKDVKSGVPIILAGGIGVGVKTLKAPAIDMAEEGRRVFTLSHPFENGEDKAFSYPDIDNLHSIKASNLTELMDTLEPDFPKVDVVAISEAAEYTALAIFQHPERVRSLTIVNGAGFLQKDNWRALNFRFLVGMLNPGYLINWQKTKNQIGNFFSEYRPYVREFRSERPKVVKALSNSQIFSALMELQQQGVNILVMLSKKDHVFGQDKVLETIGDNFKPASVLNKKADHANICFSGISDKHGISTAKAIVWRIEQEEILQQQRDGYGVAEALGKVATSE